MTKIRVGCKRHLLSSKEGGAYLIFADIKTATKTYKAFDILVPEEGKEGKEEIDEICPYCQNNVKIHIKRKRPSKCPRDVTIVLFVVCGIFHSLISLYLESMRIVGFIVLGLSVLIIIQLMRERPSKYLRDSIIGLFVLFGIISLPFFLKGGLPGFIVGFIVFGLLVLIIGGLLYYNYRARGGGERETYISSLYINDPDHEWEILRRWE